jgi:hypothetical protein
MLFCLAPIMSHANQAVLEVHDYMGKTATLMDSPCDPAPDLYSGFVVGNDQRVKLLCWAPMDKGVYIIDAHTKVGTFIDQGKTPSKKPRLDKLQ